MNTVQLIGRLSVDPQNDVVSSPDQIIIARLAVAPDGRFTGVEPPEILPIAAEGHLGEEILDCLAKGALVAVVGQLRTRRQRLEVLAKSVEPLDRPIRTLR